LVIAETLRHFSIFTVAKVESKELVSLGLLTQLLEIEESGVDGDGEALRLANNIPTTDNVTQTPVGNSPQKL